MVSMIGSLISLAACVFSIGVSATGAVSGGVTDPVAPADSSAISCNGINNTIELKLLPPGVTITGDSGRLALIIISEAEICLRLSIRYKMFKPKLKLSPQSLSISIATDSTALPLA